MKKNESGHFRGLHIVVIDGNTGKVEKAQVFDTYASSDGFDTFLSVDLNGDDK